MTLLGALPTRLPLFSLEQVMGNLEKGLPECHRRLLPANRAALMRGFELAGELGVAAGAKKVQGATVS